MAKKLVTGWVGIATSGMTADNRELKAADLVTMAETYSTTEYEAVISLEHIRWFGSFGRVIKLKTEKDDKGRVRLFAILEPDASLLFLVRSGQKRYSSVEIQPNFAGTGKPYLIGMAITDHPASLGTTPLDFSHRASEPGTCFFCTDEIHGQDFIPLTRDGASSASSENSMTTLTNQTPDTATFADLDERLAKLEALVPSPAPSGDPLIALKDELAAIGMKFKGLLTSRKADDPGVAALRTEIDAFRTRIDASLTPDQHAGGSGSDGSEGDPPGGESRLFNRVVSLLEQQGARITALSDAVTKATGEVPGTKLSAHTGNEDDHGLDLF
uniref:Phage capsid scaffolding protein (GPO) serine peptidase n=1 Tax=Candidatus Kentrum sp. FM TaxID=2126340 RepID=A0A450VLF7_9GAMM|nr:MAG: Phage capsid scaffolding protein (GPO) serine peptidase [Candidatus Kentron sp. FM]VFJ43626.1 MAG: Phage capsid scaffolding protein (GPO) serine peptidase [Candidatus Kentron sp. FM]VFK05644.1 MAG: Phage capsid scaffolding protein (GPO) serine peptidase [Candidatus Kentron sp. FM]